MIRAEMFLSGVIFTASLTAGVYFLRFWKDSRDILFIAFAVFFFIEAADRVALISAEHPNEGSPWIYLLRLFGLALLFAAILRKNYGDGR